MIGIYSINPAPWGDDYRLVELFDTKAGAEKVLEVLESVNIYYNEYKIVDWSKSDG